MRDKQTLLRQCRDLIDQDKLETLFRVYGLTDPIQSDMDVVSTRDSLAEIPSTPAFAVRPKLFPLFFRAAIALLKYCGHSALFYTSNDKFVQA